MEKIPFSLANLTDTGQALYGHGWQPAMARALALPLRSLQRWYDGSGTVPDLRKPLADLCRRYAAEDSRLLKLAPLLEKLGPPER